MALAWLGFGCSSAPHLQANFGETVRLEARYESAVTTESWLDAAKPFGTEPLHPQRGGSDARSIHVAIYSFDDARFVLPHVSLAPRAEIVDASCANAAFDAAITAGAASLVASETLTFAADGRGSMSLLGQTSFIAGYECQANDLSMIADPQIDIAQDGLVVDVASAGDAFSLTWTSSSLERPIATTSVAFGPNRTPMRMQVPVFWNHRLHAETAMPLGRAILLSGLSLHTDQRLVAVLTPLAPHVANDRTGD